MILNPSLRAYVRQHAEDRPGVYRMLGPEEEILYVGKSVRVKSRLLSYFRAEPGEKAGKLIRNTLSVEWDYVPNEFAALVQEMRLIKRWRPRYNVEHKRKRSFAFIKITREPAPRIIPVARILPDEATYFGPFPRPTSLAQSLGELCHVLRLRDCPGTVPMVFGDQLEIFERGRATRCIRAQTGSCLGPCCGACSSADYARKAETARRFLEGRSREPLALLQEEMEKASEALYLIRKGLVEEEIPNPRGKAGRKRAAEKIEGVFETPTPEVGLLSQEAASEILLVARWFRLRDREMARALEPEKWLRLYAPT